MYFLPFLDTSSNRRTPSPSPSLSPPPLSLSLSLFPPNVKIGWTLQWGCEKHRTTDSGAETYRRVLHIILQQKTRARMGKNSHRLMMITRKDTLHKRTHALCVGGRSLRVTSPTVMDISALQSQNLQKV